LAAGSNQSCTANTRCGENQLPKGGSTLGVQIDRIDFDDLRNTSSVLDSIYPATSSATADVVRTTVGDVSPRTATQTIMTRAAMRKRKRHRDEPGLHGSQERHDVIKALRSQDHRPVSDRRTKLSSRARFNVRRASRDHVRLSETPAGFVDVIGEGEGYVAGAEAGTSVQHRENG